MEEEDLSIMGIRMKSTLALEEAIKMERKYYGIEMMGIGEEGSEIAVEREKEIVRM
jgi:hypothetical protein